MKRSIFSRKGDEGDSGAALRQPADRIFSGPVQIHGDSHAGFIAKRRRDGHGIQDPPSTRSTPLYRNGVKKSGIANEARMASKRLPDRIQTSFCPLRSVATAVNEMGRSSINFSPTRPIRVLTSFSPSHQTALLPRKIEQREDVDFRQGTHPLLILIQFTGSVYAPDDCTDRTADDRLDLEVIFFEPMNDADVRQTSGAAASENQGHGLSVRRGHFLILCF